MKLFLSILILWSGLCTGGNPPVATSALPQQAQLVKAVDRANAASVDKANLTAAVVRYRINPAQSRFMANVGSGGLLWLLGHSHHFAIRDFAGEAAVTPESIAPASLEITVRTVSLEETGKNFTEQQKQTINNSAHKEVLQADEYPEIIFKSTNITGKPKPGGQYEAKIAGNLTLHGVTRPIEFPTQVTVNQNTLHATGEFSINRSDYKVKTHSIKGGLIRVRNKITFEFDIVANQV